MESSSLNLNIIVIRCALLVSSLIDSTRMLQIFNGTLTKITCSAAVPAAMAVYRLVDQERVYNNYSELPDFFDIEASRSPTGNNVTLYISGTNRSNNVTVMCINLDLSVGHNFNDLFTLILEFVGILPAPNDVHYIEESPGHLQILWEPPTLDSDEPDSQIISIRRDARILSYTIYITTEESSIVQVYNTSGTSFAIGIDKIPCSFWFQVAAVNPAGVGERSPSLNLTFDRCMSSSSSTIVMIIEPIPASSGLSAGEIAAVIVGVICSLAGVCIICLFILLKMNPKLNRHSKTTEEEIEMKQNEIYGMNTRSLRTS